MARILIVSVVALAALAVMQDGSLLVADDTGGTIWRIAFTGAR